MNALTQSPVIRQLAHIGNRAARVDIVSPSLCDDVIRRLAPSLEQYKGCTIIDNNPGVSVFSAKLHDFLRPSSHILIEPKHKQYASFLDPLLSGPGSRYHLQRRRVDGHEQLLADIKDGLGSEHIDGSNNAILEIHNTTEKRVVTESRANLKVDLAAALRFVKNARQATESPTRRQTRMLMWCEDKTKQSILPRNVARRQKISVLMEAYCRVEEVVGFGEGTTRAQREGSLKRASSRRVRRLMKELDIPLIPGREVETADASASLPDVSRHWHQELQDLTDQLESGAISKFVDQPPGKSESSTLGGRQDGSKYSPEFLRYKSLSDVARAQSGTLGKAQDLAEQQLEIDALDLRTYSPALSSSERKELLEEYDSRNAAFKEKVSRLDASTRQRFYHIVDDRHAFQSSPPLLCWDNRTYEPLAASLSEFYNPKELALLDLQAKPPGTYPVTEEQEIYMDLLATALFVTKGAHNFRQLKVVAPGAYEALMPKIKEISDARCGGRRDVDNVRIRSMTPRMLWRLAVEWSEWPFKPLARDL